MSEKLTNITESQSLVSQELNNQVLAVLSNKVEGFEKAFVMASAIGVLKEKLTPEFMKPIMDLQGSKLGFRTDKDMVKNRTTNQYEKGPGYPESVVKNCLIEMVLVGIQPTGNQFNIIGGNSYITKEGATALLKQQPGLDDYVITYPNVVQSQDKLTATVSALIKWDLNDKKNEQKVDFPVKSDAYTTFDALVGKTERKAKIWLYNYINGTNLSDGDITDIPHTVVSSEKPKVNEVAIEKERQRVINHINSSKDVETLERCLPAISDDDFDLIVMYEDRKRELKPSKK